MNYCYLCRKYANDEGEKYLYTCSVTTPGRPDSQDLGQDQYVPWRGDNHLPRLVPVAIYRE